METLSSSSHQHQAFVIKHHPRHPHLLDLAQLIGRHVLLRDLFRDLLGPSVVEASGLGGFLTAGQYLRPRLDLSRPGVEKTTGQGSHRRLIRTREA